MSDERRQNLRTQGRFSDDVRTKSKKLGVKSYAKERNIRNSHHGSDAAGDGLFKDQSCLERRHTSSDTETSVKYERNSNYTNSFSQLKTSKKPKEIKNAGVTVLSETENGESRVFFKPDFLSATEAYELCETLASSTKWCDKNIFIRGKEVPQPRLVAWYGPFPYEYSGLTLEPREFTPKILEIKEKIEKVLQEQNIQVELNSVLMNLYRDGKDSVAWHSDNELSMGVCPTIASVSLGESRKFEMRRIPMTNEEKDPKEDMEFFTHLKNGSLIVMDGCMQKDWQHRVPKEYHDKPKRINLTFRRVYPFNKLPRDVPREKHLKYNTNNFSVSSTQEEDKTFELSDEFFPPLSKVVSSKEVTRSDVEKSPSFPESHPKACNISEISERAVSDEESVSNSIVEPSIHRDDLTSKETSLNNAKDENLLTDVSKETEPQSFAPGWPHSSLDAPAFMPDPHFVASVGNIEKLAHKHQSIQDLNDSLKNQCVPTNNEVLEDFSHSNQKMSINKQDDNIKSILCMSSGMNHIEFAELYLSAQTDTYVNVSENLSCFKDAVFHEMHNMRYRDRKELEVLCEIAKDCCKLPTSVNVTILNRMCEIILDDYMSQNYRSRYPLHRKPSRGRPPHQSRRNMSDRY